MHPNLFTFGVGLWFIGTGIDGIVPNVTTSGLIKVTAGVIVIIASIIGA